LFDSCRLSATQVLAIRRGEAASGQRLPPGLASIRHSTIRVSRPPGNRRISAMILAAPARRAPCIAKPTAPQPIIMIVSGLADVGDIQSGTEPGHSQPIKHARSNGRSLLTATTCCSGTMRTMLFLGEFAEYCCTHTLAANRMTADAMRQITLIPSVAAKTIGSSFIKPLRVNRSILLIQ
jgi:hypothetical protein